MLLDTHVWIWAAADAPRRLGPKTRRLIAKAARDGELFVSTASVFEITALVTAARLKLTQPVARWIAASIERGALRVLDVGIGAALDAGAIPSSALADPIDRLLVATSREHQLPLVTRDEAIADYARRTRLVNVIDASR